ncbi:MAG: SDR family oxidoreductase [Pseudomonadales bacterium]|nr:SDR family oxidoreductase [Pseudomonadales bacterium]
MIEAFNLDGKVAFITGAGRGIGRGIAAVLAEAGAEIAINALTETHAAVTAEEIKAATGKDVLVALGDVTTTSGVAAVTDQVMARFGRIDILVNNLGDAIRTPLVALPDAGGEGISDEALQRIVDLNMTATVLCTRAVAPQMLERRAGKIINISSYTAGSGGSGVVIYSMAKAAVVGFTRAQAQEWAGQGINVNVIAPGLYPEPRTLTEERAAQLAGWAKKRIPLGRTGELREPGYLALYLASAASDYMTGQTLYLDGGMSL